MRAAIRFVLERLLLLAFGLLVCLGIFEVYLRSVMLYKPALGAYVEDWDLGKRLVPGFQGDHYNTYVEINSHGMRDREFAPERATDSHRILVLGDSWTFGVGVGQDETWPKRLESELEARLGADWEVHPEDAPRRYEVMNAGVSGYETYNEALYYDRDLRKFEHDLVLVGMYPVNDVHDKQAKYARHKRMYDLSPLLYDAYTFPSRHLYTVQAYKQWRRDRKTRRRQAHYGETTQADYQAGEHGGFARGEDDWTELYEDDYRGWRVMQESLVSIGRTAAESGVKGAVVLFPDLRDLKRNRVYCHARVAPKIAKAVAEAGLVLIDLEPDFFAYAGREGEISLGGNVGATHPNAAGDALIGRAVAREIVSRGLLPDAPL